MRLWFGGGPDVDKAISSAFKEDLDACGRGERDHWKADKMGILAFIILTDQFSRNIYRRQGQAFSFDPLALELAKQVVQDDANILSYKHFERIFIMMPLMHSENVEDLELCKSSIQKFLVESCETLNLPDLANNFRYNLKFAQDHLDVVLKFGRFPSRNQALGRENTAEEEEYLKTAITWG